MHSTHLGEPYTPSIQIIAPVVQASARLELVIYVIRDFHQNRSALLESRKSNASLETTQKVRSFATTVEYLAINDQIATNYMGGNRRKATREGSQGEILYTTLLGNVHTDTGLTVCKLNSVAETLTSEITDLEMGQNDHESQLLKELGTNEGNVKGELTLYKI